MAKLSPTQRSLEYLREQGYHVEIVEKWNHWARIRQDFPDIFNEMAKLERELGRSCLRSCFLDELPPDTTLTEPIVADCGSVGEGCEIELSRYFYSRD